MYGDYLIFCGQQYPLFVQSKFVNFGQLDPTQSVDDVVYADYNRAYTAVPPREAPSARPTLYAYYRAPGDGGIIVPTIFTPSTAPVTVGLMRKAVENYLEIIDHALTVQAVSIAGGVLARLTIPAAAQLGRAWDSRSFRRWQSRRQAGTEPNLKAPLPKTKEPAASTASPKAAVSPASGVWVPKRLSEPLGERVTIKAQSMTVFHAPGANDPPPQVVFNSGLPSRGSNLNLWDHVTEIPGSGLRGATRLPGEAAEWAGGGQELVYKITNVPAYDVNAALQQIDRGIVGFAGNPLRGENEYAIRAAVPPNNIAGYYPVVDGKLGAFVSNPRRQGSRPTPR